jgi:hypothetical protein
VQIREDFQTLLEVVFICDQLGVELFHALQLRHNFIDTNSSRLGSERT